MPYTPPSHPSPASSASNSPDASRRSSIQSFQSSPRPNLPRSASYLNKHRRASSIVDGKGDPFSPLNGAADMNTMALKDLGGSVRQSPPPRVDRNELIPKGAVISPPESTASGSDDDDPPEVKSRRSEALKDLRVAVSKISKPTTPPPQPTQPKITIPPPLHTSYSSSALTDLPLPGRGRRNGHVRCATEPHASLMQKAVSSSAASDEETDEEDPKYKPQMVRKKSGELVRPALRGHRRPSSMPGTPLSSKAVHFDSHLEHVRHFLQVDRPLAVSAGSSPAETYESDSEYPFPRSSRISRASPPYEWELATPNFPHDSLIRKALPVRLEKVWLSNDQNSLLGSVVVANLAFNKSVVCRFTLDYWKTVSEVKAEYSHEIRPRESPQGQDRFTFTIKLSDMADLESKTMFFCIRYSVNGQEFWDNNDSTNFQIDFKKKHLPRNGKNNFQGVGSKPLGGGLPRSNRRQNDRSIALRPLSMPGPFDAFGNEDSVLGFEQPIHEYLGESDTAGGLRFKSKSSSSLASDNIARDLVSPSGGAFSNRYDFSASLDAAVKAAKDATSSNQTRADEKETLYMKRNSRNAALQSAASTSTGVCPANPSLSSASYEELVNKYCFFGSATKQSSPSSRDGIWKVGTTDEDKGQQALGAGFEKLSVMENQVPHRHHDGSAMHHNMYYVSTKSPYYSTINSAPNTHYLTGSPAGQQESFALGLPRSRGRTTPSMLTSGSGTPGSEVVAERFPWTADAHTATAIQS